jgi:hypothetical protein
VTETCDATTSIKVFCERLLAGERLCDICRDDPDMASVTPVSRRLAAEAGTTFRQRHAFECEFWADQIAEELLEIADDYSVALCSRCCRIEAVKQLLGALAPQKFGD